MFLFCFSNVFMIAFLFEIVALPPEVLSFQLNAVQLALIKDESARWNKTRVKEKIQERLKHRQRRSGQEGIVDDNRETATETYSAGLEKDTDNPEGIYHELDTLKAMRPGPGVQVRQEMPVQSKEKTDDLRRRKKRDTTRIDSVATRSGRQIVAGLPMRPAESSGSQFSPTAFSFHKSVAGGDTDRLHSSRGRPKAGRKRKRFKSSWRTHKSKTHNKSWLPSMRSTATHNHAAYLSSHPALVLDSRKTESQLRGDFPRSGDNIKRHPHRTDDTGLGLDIADADTKAEAHHRQNTNFDLNSKGDSKNGLNPKESDQGLKRKQEHNSTSTSQHKTSDMKFNQRNRDTKKTRKKSSSHGPEKRDVYILDPANNTRFRQYRTRHGRRHEVMYGGDQSPDTDGQESQQEREQSRGETSDGETKREFNRDLVSEMNDLENTPDTWLQRQLDMIDDQSRELKRKAVQLHYTSKFRQRQPSNMDSSAPDDKHEQIDMRFRIYRRKKQRYQTPSEGSSQDDGRQEEEVPRQDKRRSPVSQRRVRIIWQTLGTIEEELAQLRKELMPGYRQEQRRYYGKRTDYQHQIYDGAASDGGDYSGDRYKRAERRKQNVRESKRLLRLIRAYIHGLLVKPQRMKRSETNKTFTDEALIRQQDAEQKSNRTFKGRRLDRPQDIASVSSIFNKTTQMDGQGMSTFSHMTMSHTANTSDWPIMDNIRVEKRQEQSSEQEGKLLDHVQNTQTITKSLESNATNIKSHLLKSSSVDVLQTDGKASINKRYDNTQDGLQPVYDHEMQSPAQSQETEIPPPYLDEIARKSRRFQLMKALQQLIQSSFQNRLTDESHEDQDSPVTRTKNPLKQYSIFGFRNGSSRVFLTRCPTEQPLAPVGSYQHTRQNEKANYEPSKLHRLIDIVTRLRLGQRMPKPPISWIKFQRLKSRLRDVLRGNEEIFPVRTEVRRPLYPSFRHDTAVSTDNTYVHPNELEWHESRYPPDIGHSRLRKLLRFLLLTHNKVVKRGRRSIKQWKPDPVNSEEIKLKQQLEQLLKRFPESPIEKEMEEDLKLASKGKDIGQTIVAMVNEDEKPFMDSDAILARSDRDVRSIERLGLLYRSKLKDRKRYSRDPERLTGTLLPVHAKRIVLKKKFSPEAYYGHRRWARQPMATLGTGNKKADFTEKESMNGENLERTSERSERRTWTPDKFLTQNLGSEQRLDPSGESLEVLPVRHMSNPITTYGETEKTDSQMGSYEHSHFPAVSLLDHHITQSPYKDADMDVEPDADVETNLNDDANNNEASPLWPFVSNKRVKVHDPLRGEAKNIDTVDDNESEIDSSRKAMQALFPLRNRTSSLPVPPSNFTSGLPLHRNITSRLLLPPGNLTSRPVLPPRNRTSSRLIPPGNRTSNRPIPHSNHTSNLTVNNTKVYVEYLQGNSNVSKHKKVHESALQDLDYDEDEKKDLDNVRDDDDDDDDEEDEDEDESKDVEEDGIELDDKGKPAKPKDDVAFVEIDEGGKKEEYSWGDWSECSMTCGLGTRFRSNKCVKESACPEHLASTEEEVCSIADEC